MVKIGETLFVSSVEVIDRDAGKGVGHLFKIDMAGRLSPICGSAKARSITPAASTTTARTSGCRSPNTGPTAARSSIASIPATMKATEVFRVADHIGAIVHDTDRRTLHGVSWGSRRFYRWTLSGVEQATARSTRRTTSIIRTASTPAGDRMLCTGVAEIRQAPRRGAVPARRLDLVSLADGRPLHQAAGAAVDRRRPRHDAQPGLDRAAAAPDCAPTSCPKTIAPRSTSTT